MRTAGLRAQPLIFLGMAGRGRPFTPGVVSRARDFEYEQVLQSAQLAWLKAVVTTGDGILARFDAPNKTIRCSVAIREGVRTLSVDIRGGIHAGAYKLIVNELVGLAIHIGARVAAKGGAREVLVSSTVKELVSDSFEI